MRLLDRLKPLIGQRIDLLDYEETLSQRILTVASSLEKHIRINRLKTGRPTNDVPMLALKSVLSEVALTKRISLELNESVRWASEVETFRGPYDIILLDGFVDVKCGVEGSTVTFMKSERDKVWRLPEFEDVIHVRCDWCDDCSILVTHVYRARSQPWIWSPSNNADGLEEHDMTYYLIQKDIR